MGVEYKEVEASRVALAQPNCTFDIFNTCPLLGGYFRTLASTSPILQNLFQSQFGVNNPGWMTQVETVARILERSELIEQARRFIQESCWRMNILAHKGYELPPRRTWYEQLSDTCKKFNANRMRNFFSW
jgi:hypothetical protein